MSEPPANQPLAIRTLDIPLKNSEGEVIELDLSKLPDGSEMLGILRQEGIELGLWCDVAVEYYRQGRESEYLQIIERAKYEAFCVYKDVEMDRMKVIDSMAAYFAKCSLKERDKKKKNDLLMKATMLYSSGDNIIMQETNHLLGRAYFCLLNENLEQAESQYNFVLENVDNKAQNSIPWLLGKACVAYMKKDWRSALAFYRKALQVNPTSTSDALRVALGLCFMKLGQHEKAQLAFLRAIELNTKSVPALVGLSIYYMNMKTHGSIKRAVHLLSKAYTINPNDPMVLNHLAAHFFYRGEYTKSFQLATHALQNTEHQGMRAESCFIMARVLHMKDDYDSAFQYYYQSTQYAAPTFVLPFYGLGQMYIHKGDIPKAISCFKRVLKTHPNNYESLKILGSLLADSSNPEERATACEYLRKVIKEHPDDVEVWIDLAQILEQNEPVESLRCYMAVIRLYDEAVGAPVPAEILNNIGALHYRMGKYEEAEQYFEETLRRASSDFHSSAAGTEMPIDDGAVAIHVTACYNLGRLQETCHRYDEAEITYKNILKQHPNYVDCYLRLGCMARDRGSIYEASDWFKDALQLNNEHPDPWTLIGNLHLSKNEWQPGQKKFERILANPATAHDTYSMVALGNIWLHTLQACIRDPEKEKRHQERALYMYKMALKHDPRNIWATNGIGAVLAQKGYINEARDIFAQVREATADFPDVWINIAHLYVEQKQYVAAVLMYENCMKKFYKHHSIEILQFVARAHYKNGKLREAKLALLKARRVAPFDKVLLYNLAFILQKMAIQSLRDDKSHLPMVLAAVNDLTQAHTYFQFLSKTSSGVTSMDKEKARFDPGQAAAEAKQCRDLLSQAQYHVARARKADEEEQEQRKRQEEERKAAKARQLLEQARLEEEKRRQHEELLRKREEFKEQRKSALHFSEPTPSPSSRPMESKSGRRRGKIVVSDASSDGANGEEGSKSKRKRGTHEKKKRGKDQRPRKSQGRTHRGGIDTREHELNKRDGTEGRIAWRGRIVSRELISSSSSSDEETETQPSYGHESQENENEKRGDNVEVEDDAELLELLTGKKTAVTATTAKTTSHEIIFTSDEDSKSTNNENEKKSGFRGFEMGEAEKMQALRLQSESHEFDETEEKKKEDIQNVEMVQVGDAAGAKKAFKEDDNDSDAGEKKNVGGLGGMDDIDTGEKKGFRGFEVEEALRRLRTVRAASDESDPFGDEFSEEINIKQEVLAVKKKCKTNVISSSSSDSEIDEEK